MSDQHLDPATYWRLRYLSRDVDAVELESKWKVARAREHLAAAFTAAGIPPMAFSWRDADTTLVATGEKEGTP